MAGAADAGASPAQRVAPVVGVSGRAVARLATRSGGQVGGALASTRCCSRFAAGRGVPLKFGSTSTRMLSIPGQALDQCLLDQYLRESAELDQRLAHIIPRFGRFRPHLSKPVPNSAGSGHVWPNSPDIGQSFIDANTNLATIATKSADSGRIWPPSAELGQDLSIFGPRLAACRPRPNLSDIASGQNSAAVGPNLVRANGDRV